MLDYVITRQIHLNDVHSTLAMRGTCCWSDHRFVRSVVALRLCRPCRHRVITQRKLDVAKLKLNEFKQALQKTLSSQFATSQPDQPVTNTAQAAVDEEWKRVRDVTYKTASDTLGFVVSKHRDWFDEQDTAASALFQSMYSTQLAYINDKHSSAERSAYCRTKQQVQVKLREM